MEQITSIHTSYLKVKVGLEWAFWAESKLKLISISILLMLLPVFKEKYKLHSKEYFKYITYTTATDCTIHQNTSNILNI